MTTQNTDIMTLKLTARGNTNLHGGWLKGAGELAGHVKADNLSRVLPLSDGNANAGLTDPAAICAQCTQLATTGVTTSTYGLGHHFNEDLMVRMAEAGGAMPTTAKPPRI